MAARRRNAGEARHGYRARRGAGDDGARRQGAGGADRDPRRHHHAAEGADASRACSRCRSRMPRPARRDRIVWAGRKADDVAPVAAARASAVRAAEDEYRRLLYVAMTRAADRLVIAGVARREQDARGLLVSTGRECAQAGRDRGEPMTATARCCAGASRRAVDAGRGRRGAPATRAHDVPDWLRRAAPRRDRARRAISPSVGARRRACRRAACAGARAHRAPAAAGAARAAAPSAAPRRRGSISRARKDFDAAERDSDRRARCWRVLDDARFAPLFAAGSRAEVPIVGIVSQGERKVSGQVDRLAVTATEVLIADYKSDRFVPRRIEDIPRELYRATGALSRGAAHALPESPRARGAGLDRRPGADRAARRRCSIAALSRLGSA